MKIAVISDIHGNYKAYEGCMEYLDRHPVDSIFFLGDYITDGPYPQKLLTMFYDTLEKRNCYFVRGNREEYILDNEKKDMFIPSHNIYGCISTFFVLRAGAQIFICRYRACDGRFTGKHRYPNYHVSRHYRKFRKRKGICHIRRPL